MNSKYVILLIFVALLFISVIKSDCPPGELNALNNFFTTTSPWADPLSSWVNQVDCCERDYIVCDPTNSTVIEFNFGYVNQITSGDFSLDFVGLTNLTTLDLNGEYFNLLDIVLPSKISNLYLSGVGLQNFTGNFFVPSLTYLQFSSAPNTLVVGSTPMPNLKTLSIEIFDQNGLDSDGLPALENLYLYNMEGLGNIIDDVCNLKKLLILDVSVPSPASYGEVNTFPACISNLGIQEMYIRNIGFGGDFPQLNESLQYFYMEDQSFSTIPQNLPSNMIEFTCNQCFLEETEGPIPTGWTLLNNLTYLSINNNYFNSTIPSKLVKQLSEFSGNYNSFTGNVDFVLDVQEFSQWDLSYNYFYGQLPDFTGLVYVFSIDLAGNYLEGFLDRCMYCNDIVGIWPESIGVTSTKRSLKNSYHWVPSEYYELNYRVSLVTNLYNNQGFSDVETNMDNYCTSTYNDPAFIEYLPPSPLNGGSIVISNSFFIYHGLQPQLLKSNRNSRHINAAKKLNLLEPRPEEYYFEYFIDIYGKVVLRNADETNDVTLDCKMKNLNGVVECIVPEYDPAMEYDYFYFLSQESTFNDEYSLGPYSTIDVPIIDEIINDISSPLLSIFGDNFGYQYLSASVKLKSDNQSPLNCDIKNRNNSFIECVKPKVNKRDNIIYNAEVKIGSQTTTSNIEITFQEPIITPSNCFTKTNRLCDGHGECTENGFCQCDTGYFGIYCESTNSTVKPTDGNSNDNDPSGTFEQEGSTTKFTVNIIEVRELNFRSQLVQKYSPKWNFVSQDNDTYTFSSILQDNNDIVVNLTVVEQEKQINFANTSLKVEPGTLKYTVTINNYNFAQSTNILEVVFQMNAEPAKKSTDPCKALADSTTQTDPNLADIKWVQMNRGNSQMLARIINRCVIDSRIIYIQYHHEQVNNNQVNLVASIPYFEDSATIDPSYSVLLNPTAKSESTQSTDSKCNPKSVETTTKKNNDWKIATGVSIGGVAAIAGAIAGYILYQKKKEDKAFKNQIKGFKN